MTRRCALLALLLGLASCGETAPSPPPVETTTITITAAGVNPRDVIITLGQRVRFVNSDGRSHNMGSDPHPDHTDCPEINQVGFLGPGQSRETGNMVVARTCGFHDHDLPEIANLRGSITIR